MPTKKDCGSRRIDHADQSSDDTRGGPFRFSADQGAIFGRPGNPPAAIIAPPPGHCICPPCLVLVELAEDLSIGQTSSIDDDTTSAAASIVHHNRASNDYVTTGQLAQITVHHILTGHDSSNIPIGAAPLREGDRAWAYHNSQSDRWEILHQPTTITRFELTEALVAGSSAAAARVVWNGVTSQYETNAETLTVYDALGKFSSISGCRGLAQSWADSGRWEISHLDPLVS